MGSQEATPSEAVKPRQAGQQVELRDQHRRGDHHGFLRSGRAARKLQEQGVLRDVPVLANRRLAFHRQGQRDDEALLELLGPGDRQRGGGVGKTVLQVVRQQGERDHLAGRQVAQLVQQVALVFLGVDAAGGPRQNGRQLALQQQPQVQQEQLRRVGKQQQDHVGIRQRALFRKLLAARQDLAPGQFQRVGRVGAERDPQQHALAARFEPSAQLRAKFAAMHAPVPP